jgi:hypothetical protein
MKELQVLTMFMPHDAELEEPGDSAERPDPTLSSFASDSSPSQPEPSATEEPKGEHRQGGGTPDQAVLGSPARPSAKLSGHMIM